MLTRDSSQISVASGLLQSDPNLDPDLIRARASNENFPVAMRILPRVIREDLLAVYATARLIDQIGDASSGSPTDRLARLDEVEEDLDAAFEGRAEHPILLKLQSTLQHAALDKRAFLRLIEANRFDQGEVDLETWEDLVKYCTLSAMPIGELVLQIFNQATPRLVELSDDVCCALQVVEHCQDVSEDYRDERIYLPRFDRRVAGSANIDLISSPGSPALRRLLECQVMRARRLLASGPALCASLHGFARITVTGFVAGGLAACDALERAEFDPNSGHAGPRRRDFLRRFLELSWAAFRNRSKGRIPITPAESEACREDSPPS